MNIVKNQFTNTLAREGKNITLSNGSTVKCIFRKNEDYNNETDYIKVFYPVDASITIGTLFGYKGKTYLVVNQETGENDVYYKSSAVRTNTAITTNDGSVVALSAYGKQITSAMTVGSNVFQVINGNLELLTTDSELSRTLDINQTFNVFGRTFEINNLIYRDGICHIYSAVVADQKPVEYTLSIGSYGKNYRVGDTAQLSATAYTDGSVDYTATITWKSSDTSVATINANGLVTFVAVGTVTFTATWKQASISDSTTAITVNEVPEVDYTITLGEYNALATVGDTATLTASAYADGVLVPDAVITWESSNTAIATINNGVITYLAVGAVTFTATWTEQGVSASTEPITVEQSSEPPADGTWTVTFEGKQEIVYGRSRTYTINTFCNDIPANLDTLQFRIANMTSSYFTLEPVQGDKLWTCRITVADNSSLKDKFFNLCAYDTSKELTAYYAITIKSLF